MSIYNLNYVNEAYLEEVKKETSDILQIQKELNFCLYESAYIVPSDYPQSNKIGGVFDKNKKFVYNSTLHKYYPGTPIDIRGYKEKDELIIFVGTFHSIWGHAMTDSLKKLWFLETEDGKKLLADGVKLAYIYLNKKNTYTLKMLSIAGIDMNNLVEITEPTKFRGVIVPDDAIVSRPDSDRISYTIEYKKTIAKMLSLIDKRPNLQTPSYEKVYFSRKKIFQYWREFGESLIERNFKKLGYKIFYPELLTIEEQIQILRNCNYFATTEGSVSHSAIFCRPGTNVIIVRKVNRVNYIQLMINDVSNINVTYIDANCSYVYDEKKPLNGPFYLCVTKELESFFGYKIMHFPNMLKLSYWFYIITKKEWYRKYVMNRKTWHRFQKIIWRMRASISM